MLKTLRLFTLSLSVALAAGIHADQTFSIMLDPAGDAQHTGRQIGDSLERGITLQFAEQLKKTLEDKYCSSVRVILSRFPGETIHPLQNANFSNRLDIDCYVSIHFYQETQTKPRLFIYRFSYNDDFITKIPELSFCPFDQAHQLNSATTKAWCTTLTLTLNQEEYRQLFECSGVIDLPFKPLIGIKAPAFAIEVGLHNKGDWTRYIQPVAHGLGALINQGWNS